MTLPIFTKCQLIGLQDFMIHAASATEHSRAQAFWWLGNGATVAQVAQRLGVTRRTVYNWISRFEQRADLDFGERLADAPRPGRPPTASGIIDPWIDEVIEQDPRSFGYRSTVWTAPLLQHYLEDTHGIQISRQSVSRAIARLGIRWKRPRHSLANRPTTWRQAKGG